MKISEIITDKYKLRIPPNVYYDLLADVREAEEEQEPICPSAGVDCEDCPAYEDAISRKAALDAIEDDARCGVYSHFASYDDAQAFKNYIKDLPSVSSSEKPKSEWQHDHEILKAYSDGANEVLDKIRAEISERSRMHMDGDLYIKTSDCMQIIDEYRAEGGDKE